MKKIKPKLLYVDDEFFNREIFVGCFEKNYEVLTACSGKTALETLNSNVDIAIVVSDLKMPEMNGLEFINIAKKNNYKIPYFLLTGYDLSDEINEALEKGSIRNYFQKPFDYKEVELAITQALNTEKQIC